jgi:hypothetical protein
MSTERICLEMAEAFRKRGLETTVAELLLSVMAVMDREFGHDIARKLAANGVKVLTGVGVRAADAEAKDLELSDGRRLPADLVLFSVGVCPSSRWPRRQGSRSGQPSTFERCTSGRLPGRRPSRRDQHPVQMLAGRMGELPRAGRSSSTVPPACAARTRRERSSHGRREASMRMHAPFVAIALLAGCVAHGREMPMDAHGPMPAAVATSQPAGTPFVASTQRSFQELMDEAMHRMHGGMEGAPRSGDPDRDFVTQMIPHHQGAIDMAKVLLLHGKDPGLQRLAREIITDQQSEIDLMRVWLDGHPAHGIAKETP